MSPGGLKLSVLDETVYFADNSVTILFWLSYPGSHYILQTYEWNMLMWKTKMCSFRTHTTFKIMRINYRLVYRIRLMSITHLATEIVWIINIKIYNAYFTMCHNLIFVLGKNCNTTWTTVKAKPVDLDWWCWESSTWVWMYKTWKHVKGWVHPFKYSLFCYTPCHTSLDYSKQEIFSF